MKNIIKLALIICVFVSPVYAGWSNPHSVGNSIGQDTFPQIAIGSDGRPHIAYYDSNQSKIYYRKKNGDGIDDWTGPDYVEDASVGYISMVLDNSDKPHVCYIDNTNYVYYIYHNGSNWSNPGVFKAESIAQITSMAYGDNNNYYIAFKNDTGLNGLRFYDPQNNPYVFDIDTENNDTGKGLDMVSDGTNLVVSYYHYDGGANYGVRCRKHLCANAGGVWTDYHTGGNPVDTTNTIGEITAIALDEDYNRPHIVYSNRTSGKYMYKYYTGNGWSQEEVVDNTGGSWLIDIDVKKFNEPHIVYYNQNTSEIKYACKDSQGSWKTETIDDTVGNYSMYSAIEKRCPSIKFDSNGNLHVAYHSTNNGGTISYAYYLSGPKISGYVMDISSNGITGISMKMTGSNGEAYDTVTTDANGFYEFAGLQDRFYYRVTPEDISSETDYTFSPSYREINEFAMEDLTWNFLVLDSDSNISHLQPDDEVIIGNTIINPNDPAKNKCRVIYKLSHDQNITIKVFDLTGNLVKTIVEDAQRTQGTNMNSEDEWDGSNTDFEGVASGIYYIVVEGDSWSKAQKVAIVKEKK